MDIYYDIPIFKSLPKILNNENNIFKNNDKNKDLKKIYIEDIYQLEPFKNYKKKLFFFILYIFIFFIFLYFVFIKKY